MQQTYRPTSKIVIKSGNTFNLLCSYTDENGLPLSLSQSVITAKVKDANKSFVVSLTPEILSEYSFRLTPPTDLPVGVFYTDIRLTENNVVRNSDILQINIIDVVTD